MVIRHNGKATKGYCQLTSADDGLPFMDFGTITLEQDGIFHNAEAKERALLLLRGEIDVVFNCRKLRLYRGSFLDENPVCIHVPRGMDVTLHAVSSTELTYQAVENSCDFAPKVYAQDDCRTDQFGKKVLGETSLRYVRTIFDNSNAPYSNMVLGEVINFPGKWSSYPPHHHVQPEVYYYRFHPSQGFGFSCEGEDVYKVYDGDTAVIRGGVVHPQTAAPGYAMYYVWVIPHTPKRWVLDRQYLDKDVWMLEDGAKIWPDK
jgi:5-deoxy-glucuronate isomerase